MNGAICVQVQHVVSGRLSIGEYCTARAELWINGRLVPIKNYWAVMQLDKAGHAAAGGSVFLDSHHSPDLA